MNRILAENLKCCISCMHFKMTYNDMGICKCSKTLVYNEPKYLKYILVSSLRSDEFSCINKCPHWEDFEGNTNLEALIKCKWCGEKKPYIDFFDKTAEFCSYDCRMAFNDEFDKSYVNEILNKTNCRRQKLSIYTI